MDSPQEIDTTTRIAATHAMTVDVEDYYHVAAFEKVISPSDWDQWPSRVEQNTHRILDLFSRANIKATFFVLGWVAQRYPALVREIVAQGHEIASHGYSHQLVFNQTPQVFRDETEKSKKILEDIIQSAVHGYRAASYSITSQSLWALDILMESGFSWDSSIFPIHHDRYGIATSPRTPYVINSKHGLQITEFPLTTVKLFGLLIPAAGGGYFRQYPYAISRWLFNKASNKQNEPQIFYLHPWELDPEQPRIPGAGLISNFRHYTNLHRCEARLVKLLADFNFGTVTNSLKAYKITTQVNVQQLSNGH